MVEAWLRNWIEECQNRKRGEFHRRLQS